MKTDRSEPVRSVSEGCSPYKTPLVWSDLREVHFDG